VDRGEEVVPDGGGGCTLASTLPPDPSSSTRLPLREGGRHQPTPHQLSSPRSPPGEGGRHQPVLHQITRPQPRRRRRSPPARAAPTHPDLDPAGEGGRRQPAPHLLIGLDPAIMPFLHGKKQGRGVREREEGVTSPLAPPSCCSRWW
jgi:hypothetical protein